MRQCNTTHQPSASLRVLDAPPAGSGAMHLLTRSRLRLGSSERAIAAECCGGA
jgi:hypothetical protein